MNISDRIKQVRNKLKLTQVEFGAKVGVKGNTITNYETGLRNPSEAVFFSICRELNVSENWLRTGQGEMFIETDEFSLDEYARLKRLTPLEFEIVKEFMSLDSDARKDILLFAKKMSSKDEEAIAKESSTDEEVENYRLELEAAKKGETSSVSEDIEGKAN